MNKTILSFFAFVILNSTLSVLPAEFAHLLGSSVPFTLVLQNNTTSDRSFGITFLLPNNELQTKQYPVKKGEDTKAVALLSPEVAQVKYKDITVGVGTIQNSTGLIAIESNQGSIIAKITGNIISAKTSLITAALEAQNFDDKISFVCKALKDTGIEPRITHKS